MGSTTSIEATNLTSVFEVISPLEIANHVKELTAVGTADEDIVLYDLADNFVKNGISSGMIWSASREELKALLTEIGIVSIKHQLRLLCELTKFKTVLNMPDAPLLDTDNAITDVLGEFKEGAVVPSNTTEALLFPPSLDCSPSDAIAALLVCCVCLDPMYNPATLTCGHNGCKTCLDRCLKVKLQCPMCRYDISRSNRDNLNVNLTLKDMIDNAYPLLAEERKLQEEEEIERNRSDAERKQRADKIYFDCIALAVERAQQAAVLAKADNRLPKYTAGDIVTIIGDDNTYVGQSLVTEGKADGHGRRTWTSGIWKGRVYIGNFANNLQNGVGTCIYGSSKNVYEGEWQGGKKHGYGVLRNETDTGKSEGQWVNGNLHGYAKKTYPDGKTYIGSWERDKKHGRGKILLADGRIVYDNDFERGNRV